MCRPRIQPSCGVVDSFVKPGEGEGTIVFLEDTLPVVSLFSFQFAASRCLIRFHLGFHALLSSMVLRAQSPSTISYSPAFSSFSRGTSLSGTLSGTLQLAHSSPVGLFQITWLSCRDANDLYFTITDAAQIASLAVGGGVGPVGVNQTGAECDTSPPTVTAFSMSGRTLNTSMTEQRFSISINFTDDCSVSFLLSDAEWQHTLSWHKRLQHQFSSLLFVF